MDGTGAAWHYGDVGVRNGHIVAVTPRGMLAHATAGRRVDATGMVVAPGFIDIQGQSGGAFLFGDGRDVSKVTQGITTEILGEGGTPAPINPAQLADNLPHDSARAKVVRTFAEPHGFRNWLQAMVAHGIAPNVGSFVGAATVRVYAKQETIGDPNAAELDTMRAVVRRAMEDGAMGMGSALIYPPGNYATTGELIEEAKAMSPYGGVYITHMRSEADQLLEAVDEAIRIGREGGVPVEIYHLKAAGKENWHKEAGLISKIDSARAAGLDVQADMYPYTAGATGLSACFPPAASEGGKLFARLADPAERAKIKAEVEHQTSDWENLCTQAGPDAVLLVGFARDANKKWAGKRLSEVAQAMNTDWVTAAMDLVLADSSRIGTVFFLMSEDNVKLQLQQPWIKIGTDAGGMDPDTAKAQGELTHPRAYGTYPRILGPVRARTARAHAGGRHPQDDVGGGDPALHSGPGGAASGVLGGHRRLRSQHHPRRQLVRRPAPHLRGHEARVRERRGDRARRARHRRQARDGSVGAGGEAVGMGRGVQRAPVVIIRKRRRTAPRCYATD